MDGLSLLFLITIHSHVTPCEQIAARAWLCYLFSFDLNTAFAQFLLHSCLPRLFSEALAGTFCDLSPGLVPFAYFSLVMTHHDWFPGGVRSPDGTLCCISPFGVCRILPRPMPLPIGSFCVLRVTFAPAGLSQKKNSQKSQQPPFSGLQWLTSPRLFFALLGRWFGLCVIQASCHLVAEFLVSVLR